MASLYITLIACWAIVISGARGQDVLCAYYTSPTTKAPRNEDAILVHDGRQVKNCTGTTNCFSFWKETTADNVTSMEFLAGGCWGASKICNQSSCIANSYKNNSYFCCCTGSLCNEDVSVPEIIEPTALPPDQEYPTSSRANDDKYIWIWVIAGVFFMVVLVCIAITALRWRYSKPPPNTVPVEEPPTSPCIDLDSIKLLESIGHGRYGTAYRAIVEGEEVAVKVFPQHHKSSYQNEKYIYTLPIMEHSNLLSYFGSGECTGPDGNPCYGLVVSYCRRGRLATYLSENTLSWPQFCQIVTSATRGLAHLHSDIRKGDLVKPCISHRDFNTRNLLLKEDLTCCVSDLGFAIHTQGAKYFINGEEQHAETSSLTDVGTLRYMAPEVLEGAVNLRDCEAALKQIDIYALGLVLWECAARCHDLYQGLQTPPYMLPFQEEIGLHPTFERVQVLVARRKARPLFPPVWKDTNPAIRLLKETIEDCWDQDAEARLSAMCVEGRLGELPVLWDRYKSSLGINGVSPTINPMSNIVSQRQGEMFSGLAGNGGKVISNALTPREKESSVSETTAETTIPGSPSEQPSEPCLGKNQLVGSLQPPMPPLQPHQGRNPCMERNLIREVPQELSVSGNTLIDHMKANDINSINTINSVNLLDALDVQHALESHGFTNEQLMPLLNGHSNTTTVAPPPRQPLPPPTLVPRIPHLQNEVRSIDNQPKRQNTAVREEENRNSAQSSGKGSSWRRWRSAWEDRLKSLIPRRRHHHSEDEERQEILVTPTSSSLSEPPTPLTATQSAPLNTAHLPMQTEVHLTNGCPHTVISPNHALNTQHSSLPNYIAQTEIGIAKLHMQNGFAPIIRSRQGSNDSGLNKSSENSVSFVDSDNSCEKLKRPTTLTLPECQQVQAQNQPQNLIQSQQTQSQSQSLVNKALQQRVGQDLEKSHNPDTTGATKAADEDESPPLRKPKHRVKTPRRPMNPRLSLYDDRIMGYVESQREGILKCEGHLDECLSHSLPIHIDTIEHQQSFMKHSDVATVPRHPNNTSYLRHSKLTSNHIKSNSMGSSQGSFGQDLNPPPSHHKV